jgi:hypothetical protein
MKKILLVLLLFVSFVSFAQTVNENFAGWANTALVTPNGAGYNITINQFTGNAKRFDEAYQLSDIQVGDVVWTETCSRFVITAVNGLTITVSDPDAGLSLPPTAGKRIAILREWTTNGHKMSGFIQNGDGNSGAITGVSNQLAACILSHYAVQVDKAISSSSSVLRTNIAPTPVTVFQKDIVIDTTGATDKVYIWNGTGAGRYDLFIAGGGGSSTTQSITGTGTATAWNSVVTVSSISPTVVTLPAITLADIGKTITIKNINSAANTQAAPAGVTLVESGTLNSGESMTFVAYDLTTIHVINDRLATTQVKTIGLFAGAYNHQTSLTTQLELFTQYVTGTGTINLASSFPQHKNVIITDDGNKFATYPFTVTVPTGETLDGVLNGTLVLNGTQPKVITLKPSVGGWTTDLPKAGGVANCDEFLATAAQTSFTLTSAPINKTVMYINGVRLPKAAYTISGTTVTYVSAINDNYIINLNDRINFDY